MIMPEDLLDLERDDLLDALRRVAGPSGNSIPLHAPEFAGNESEYVQECIRSTFVSSVGKFVDEFEAMLVDFTGVKHAVAVVNGTTALQVALTIAGVKPGDEVIVPALSFVATANAVAHCGAVPHFVDSDATTMGMDPIALSHYFEEVLESTASGVRNKRTGRRVVAIAPMHTYGHPVDMAPLVELANRYDLPIVEDAAESLGSTYHGIHTGNFGAAAILSFNGNKIVTTGGGGAVLTNDPELARHAKHLTTTAKRPHRWEFVHDEVAWNYRMPNLNAALGCAQMQRLPDFIERKRLLAKRYEEAFAEQGEFRFMTEPEGSQSNYWLATVSLTNPDMQVRNGLLDAANDAGYQCRPTWTLLHKLPMYRECPHAPLDVAERLEASLINLPSSPNLAN